MKKVREGYKMTEFGEIPEEWEVISLESIGEFKNGINKGKDDFGFGCKFVNIQDAYIGNLVDESRLGRLNVNEKEKEIYKLIDGDIIVVRSSVKPEGVGYPILFNRAKEDVVYCGFMIRYRYNINKVNPLFMLYQLRSSNVRKQVLDLSTVSANTNINQESYRKVKIILPNKKEQEKIASILSTVDEQIDNVDELIQKNKELKKGLMQQLLTKGIGHTKFKKTEIGDIPEDWEVVSLSEITDVRDGTHDSPKYLEAGIPFITSKNLKENKIDFSDVNFISEEDHIRFSQRSNVENGDILFGMIGTIGNPVIVNKEFEFSIKNVALIKFNKSSINNKYILNLLKSTIIENQFLKLSNGGVQKFIALSMIRELKIPVPKVEEQERIASILSELDKKIEEYENKKQKLEELKKGLMQELLTGKIRVI